MMRMRVTCAMVLLTTAAAANDWQGVNPLPTQADLEGVAVLADGRQIAVGEFGTILERQGDQPWSDVSSGTDVDLNDVAALGARVIAVGEDGTVLLSDAAGSWQLVDGVSDLDLHGVASGPLGYAAVGAEGEVAVSPNGTDWASSGLETENLNAVAWFDDQWVAVGDGATVATSPDGVEWAISSIVHQHDLVRIATDGTVIIALDTTGWTYSSTNAHDWTVGVVRRESNEDRMGLAHCGDQFHIATRTIGMATSRTGPTWERHIRRMHGFDFRDLACTSGGLVGVGSGGQIAETDGSFLWRGASGLGGFDLAAAASIPGVVIVGGGDWVLADVYMGPSLSPAGFLWRSGDGVSWSKVALRQGFGHGMVTSVASSGDRLMVATMGYHDRAGYWFDLYASHDGEIWDRVHNGFDQIRSITWDGGKWLALGRYTFGISDDGENWIDWDLDQQAEDAASLASNGAVIVVVGDGGRIARSTNDGDVWARVDSPMEVDLRSVSWGHGRFVAVGKTGAVLTSSDGLQWQQRSSGVDEDLTAVRSIASGFAVVGDGGRLLRSTDGDVWIAEIVAPGHTLLDVIELEGSLHVFGRDGLAVREVSTGSAAPIQAAFSWQPVHPEPDQATRFVSRGTGEISTSDWSFGDGATGEGEVVEHSFSEAGSYRVDVVVSGPSGSDTVSQEVVVEQRCTASEPPIMAPAIVNAEDGGATFSWSNPSASYFEVEISTSPSFQGSGFFDYRWTLVGTTFSTDDHWPDVTAHYARVRAETFCPGGYVWSRWSDAVVAEYQPWAQAPGSVQTMVAAAAHTSGVGDTFWTSDLVLFNPGSRSATVAVELQGAEARPLRHSLRVGETLVLGDLVGEMVDWEAVGSLLIGSNEPVVAVSRTGTAAGGGRYGQLIPARVPARPPTPSSRIIGLVRSDSFRSNLGFASAWPEASVIRTQFRSADGQSVLGERVDHVPEWGHEHLTDVLKGLGSGEDLNGVQAVLTIDDADAELIAYASVVDNGTGDPTYIEVAVPPAGGTMLIPSVARVAGLGGSIWRSELVLTNIGDSGSFCEIQWLERDSDNSHPLSVQRSMGAGESLVIADVMDELFGFEGVGALLVHCDPGSVAAVSRTFTLAENGTYGQAVPALDLKDALDHGRNGVLPGLSESEDPEAGSRSNLGLVSLCEDSMSVAVDFLDAGGAQTATRAYELRPFEVLQRTRVLRSVGMADSRPVSLRLSSVTPGCGFAAWASIVDNHTQDPVFLVATRAVRVAEPIDPIAVLDNDAAMVIDRQPQAVSFPAVPSGSSELSVHGSGALGSLYRPLQVLCLWRGPGGSLMAEAMDVGGTAAGIQGDGPVWCVVPDIESCADNRGWIRVDLRGPNGTTDSIDLDPAANCVEIDGLAGARPVDPNLAHWWLTTHSEGDLGTAVAEPLALLVSWESPFLEAHRQKARIVRRGESLLDLDVPAFAVVVDWGTASDNRGRFWFESD